MASTILKTYTSSVILLAALVIGGIGGVVFGTDAAIVKPLGDLFLNLLFMIIVPLVFFSISSAIANMEGMKRLGRIMGSIFLVFFLTAALSAVIGFIGTSLINPLENTDVAAIEKLMDKAEPTEA
jgi:Na+/H+-dicarboxylate symporter